MTDNATELNVRTSIVVEVPAERAYTVFTEGIDTWWPRDHHLGASPLKQEVIEPRLGGRCYGISVDGTECDWGRVLAWEPPHRLVFAWMITPQWTYEPDVAKSSEVEVSFISEGPSRTRVELEHRAFERLGEGGDAMRTAVASPDGWPMGLQLFAKVLQG